MEATVPLSSYGAGTAPSYALPHMGQGLPHMRVCCWGRQPGATTRLWAGATRVERNPTRRCTQLQQNPPISTYKSVCCCLTRFWLGHQIAVTVTVSVVQYMKRQELSHVLLIDLPGTVYSRSFCWGSPWVLYGNDATPGRMFRANMPLFASTCHKKVGVAVRCCVLLASNCALHCDINMLLHVCDLLSAVPPGGRYPADASKPRPLFHTRCSKIAEAEAAVSVNENKWLVMHMHVQLQLDELRGPQTLGSL